MESTLISITSALMLSWCWTAAVGAEGYLPSDYQMEYDLGPGPDIPGFGGEERVLRKRNDYQSGPYININEDHNGEPIIAHDANSEPDFHPDHLEYDPSYLSKRQNDYEEANDPRTSSNQRRIQSAAAETLRRRRQYLETAAARPNSPVLRPKRQNSVQETQAFKAMRESKFPSSDALKRFSRSSPPPSPESNEFFGFRTKFGKRAMKDRIEDPAEWGEGSGRSLNQLNKPGSTVKPKIKRELFHNEYVTSSPPAETRPLPISTLQQPQEPSPIYDWRNENGPSPTNFENNEETAFRNQMPGPAQEDELRYPDFGGNYEYEQADYREGDPQREWGHSY